MKKIALIAMAAVFALGLGLSAAVAVDAPAGPIKVTNFGKKGVVSFDHAKHVKTDCKSCHHNDGGYKCGECHGAKGGDAPSFKDASHKKGVGACYDCHRAKDAVKKMKCGECHG